MANPTWDKKVPSTGTYTKRTPQQGDWKDTKDEQVADESVIIIPIVGSNG